MKKLFFLFCFLSALAVNAQQVKNWGMVPYGPVTPTVKPAVYDYHVFFNTTNSDLYTYNRTTKVWGAVAKQLAYGEMSINNDTTSISFAATTAAPVEELTAGQLSGFTMVGDSALRYDGLAAGKFLVNYSASFSFAEAANIINGYPIINTTSFLRARFRQTATLTTDRVNVSGSGILTLTPGQTIRFMFVPSTHTGTDVLTVYEFNLNATQLR